jgi:predicted transcriptional regulator
MASASINLSDEEQAALNELAQQTGKSTEELLHSAVQQMLLRRDTKNRRELLAQAKGMWRDRTDLPDYEELRREFDRKMN